jgi:hypothetical protein
MNYMEKEEDISNLCRKLSPPLGKSGYAFWNVLRSFNFKY